MAVTFTFMSATRLRSAGRVSVVRRCPHGGLQSMGLTGSVGGRCPLGAATKPEWLKELLKPFPAEEMSAYPVGAFSITPATTARTATGRR